MELELLTYNMSPSVIAFSTTRMGGVSTDSYSSFNITDYCGDSQENVRANRKILCNKLGINDGQLFLPRQTHSTNILLLDDAFLKLTEEEKIQKMDGVDSLVTSIPNICIGVSTADCVPILIYDQTNKITAGIHAGWRGTVNNIVGKTLSFLTDRFSCHPDDLKVIIGPSISKDAFEVGNEVYKSFSDAGFPMSDIASFVASSFEENTYEGIHGKWHIDLWAANCILLERFQIPLDNIVVANVCTYNNSDSFFSARKLGVNSGRMFTGIMMK